MADPTPATASPAERTFRKAYCDRFDCSPEHFEGGLHWRCIPWLARPLALCLKVLRPSFFSPELDVIANVGMARSLAEVYAAANDLAAMPGARDGLLRGVLRQRMSGRRLMAVAAKVWPGVPPPTPTVATATATNAGRYEPPQPKSPGIHRVAPSSAPVAPPPPAPPPKNPHAPRKLGIRQSPYGVTGTRREPRGG